MSKSIKCLLLDVDTVIISEIYEMDAEIGDPDCKLINPYVFKDENNMEPWPKASNQIELMVRSSDILTIADPKPEVIEKYLELTGE